LAIVGEAIAAAFTSISNEAGPGRRAKQSRTSSFVPAKYSARLVENILSRTPELFQRQWHNCGLLVSGSFPRRKPEGALLQAQDFFAAAVPGLRQLPPPLRFPLRGVAAIDRHRRQIPQGAGQPLLVVPLDQPGQDPLGLQQVG